MAEESESHRKQAALRKAHTRIRFDIRKSGQHLNPISEYQAIQFMLADMATEIEAARSPNTSCGCLVTTWKTVHESGIDGKVYASEMANRVTYKAIQIHGGYGYSQEYPVERYYREARVTTLYEGTSEIQRIVIARNLLK